MNVRHVIGVAEPLERPVREVDVNFKFVVKNFPDVGALLALSD